MKRKCGTCKALDCVYGHCALGYPTKKTYVMVYCGEPRKGAPIVEWVPIEECPKPLTHAAMLAEFGRKRREELI